MDPRLQESLCPLLVIYSLVLLFLPTFLLFFSFKELSITDWSTEGIAKEVAFPEASCLPNPLGSCLLDLYLFLTPAPAHHCEVIGHRKKAVLRVTVRESTLADWALILEHFDVSLSVDLAAWDLNCLWSWSWGH